MSFFKCISLSDESVVTPPCASVLCLGNFDGVHLAHQELLNSALHLRKTHFPKAACAVFCFEEPSSDYLLPHPPAHLSTLRQKMQYFAKLGIEYLFVADFEAMRNLTPSEFANNILKKQCNCVAAVCGFNYRFGKHGSGTADQLQQLLNTPAFVQPEITSEGKTVSSTEIRALLSDGQVDRAAQLLTRPYCFEAEVVHGKSLGHTIGVPTINQFFPPKALIPKHGVYVTDCEIDGKIYRGVSNVGIHPTVDHDARVNCETHLLGISQNLYGRTIKISFLYFLRPEQKFTSLEELCNQLQADIQAAKEI